ncbi:MAG TPA: diaminopimelate epimerase [Thermoanaerobaculia bacterium]|nr:diaminopimelate epimerase [Thermoanaerobaculia bacterium]
MTLPTRFVKMAGGGNDFLLFEADGRPLSEKDRRRIALLCRRGLSVGADGALFLSGSEQGRVHLDYFNADGGLASFCANGTRCAARYAVTRGLVEGQEPVLETGWGLIPARVEGASVTLRLPAFAIPGGPVGISGEGLPSEATPINVGVPHLVVFVRGDLASLPIDRLAPPLRRHPAMPDGANVNFVEVTGPGSIRVRTYERGVEGETLACGSGVVASAITAARSKLVSPPVVCAIRSGAAFTVDFSERDGQIVDARLTGDAREIYAGQLNAEAWEE